MKYGNRIVMCLFLSMVYTSCRQTTSTTNHVKDDTTPIISKPSLIDTLVLESDIHYIDGYPSVDKNGLVNVVIEIPSGTVAKWEVDKVTGHLRWTMTDGLPRKVTYLGYPGNYGMIPQTLLDKADGGDGDPLDVIILGPALTRGDVVACRLVGVIELLDKGEQDDKLIAVDPNSAFQNIHSIADLHAQFPGVVEIVETWFKYYKGPGFIEIKGISDAGRAKTILEQAIKGYESQKSK